MKILLTIHHELNPNAGAPGVTWQLGQEYQKLGHDVQYYTFDNLPRKLPGLAKGIMFPEFVASHISALSRKQTVDVVDASTGDAWVWAKMRDASHFCKNTWRLEIAATQTKPASTGSIESALAKRAVGQADFVCVAPDFQSVGDLQDWDAPKMRRRARENCPLLVTRSHGLEHVVHLDNLEEVQRGNLRLSWKYPLYHGGFRLWEVATSLRCSDLALLLNSRDAKYAVEQLGVKPERSRIVANGIPEAFLNLSFEPTPDAEDSTIRIAQVGNYIPRKGIHYGTPALNTILARYPQVKMSFLGTGCPEAEVHADFDPAVRDRILVVPRYTHEMLPTLLKGHQIKLFPSLSEGFSLALPEAMACGLAPVTTATPGSMEMVRDGHDAIAIPVRDSRAIEQALDRLIGDRPYLEQLRRNAYATAQRYSWARIARDNLSLYEEALCQRRRS